MCIFVPCSFFFFVEGGASGNELDQNAQYLKHSTLSSTENCRFKVELTHVVFCDSYLVTMKFKFQLGVTDQSYLPLHVCVCVCPNTTSLLSAL